MLPLAWRHAWKPAYLLRHWRLRRWLNSVPEWDYEDERYEERL